MKKLLGIILGSAFLAISSFALMTNAAVIGTNGGFELGTNPGVFSTVVAGDSTTITDWTVDSGEVDYIGSYWQPAEGERSLDLNGNVAGKIHQTLATVAGASYKVDFKLSGNPSGAPSAKVVRVSATGATPAFADFSYDTAVKGNTLVDMKWESDTFTFVASGTSTDLAFASQVEGASGPALDGVVITETLPVVTHTISASAGANGSISPSGSVVVNDGSNQAFTIAANSGFHILDVMVDSATVGAVSTYTFNNVTANHTISATFAADEVSDTPNKKDECKKDGWKNFTHPSFKNQGQCVAFFNHDNKHDGEDEDNDEDLEIHGNVHANTNLGNFKFNFSHKDDIDDDD